MKKGFTLIELLAVIVILAIIALIATPIVLNIIEDTKNSATLRSAEYYLSTVEFGVAKKNLTAGGSFSPNICEVQSNGNLLCDGKDILEIEVNGEVPSSGAITFNKGKITDIDITLSNKRLVKNDKGEVIHFPCILISGNKTTLGSKYECEVKPGTKYNFYVLSQEDDGTTNLIMDRNICEDGTLVTSTKICESIYDDDEINYTGPNKAMMHLNNATNDWTNISNLNLLYDDENGHFTDFAITGKARLPYKSEVSSYDGTNGYLYSNLQLQCLDDGGNPVDCEVAATKQGVFEEGLTHMDKQWSYWTLARVNQSDAVAVTFEGYVYFSSGYYILTGAGVRPVINVKL